MLYVQASYARLQETEGRRVESGEPEASLILLFFSVRFLRMGGGDALQGGYKPLLASSGSSYTVKRAKDGSLRQAAAADCGYLS